LRNKDLFASLRFHNGIRFSDECDHADFVICNEIDRPALEELKQGSERYPEDSCTLIIQCQSFYRGIVYNTSGPGIDKNRKVRCSGFNGTLLHQRKKLNQRFPLGIDLILVSGSEFFCIPRTTDLVLDEDI